MNSGSGVNEPRKYERRLIEVVAYQGEERPLTKKEVRQLLGIRTRKTFNEYLCDLGLPNQTVLNWSQIRNLVGAQLWCKADVGCNSKREYALLQARNVEGQALGELALSVKYNLSVEEHLDRLRKQFTGNISS
ncbi:MAG: hypothetical protein LRZ84_07630 [Desertifilum sp.]|nr:hypothetical protein [Desertifilum sp.]